MCTKATWKQFDSDAIPIATHFTVAPLAPRSVLLQLAGSIGLSKPTKLSTSVMSACLLPRVHLGPLLQPLAGRVTAPKKHKVLALSHPLSPH